MSDNSIKKGEAAWIAEEIFEDAALNLRSKCLAIDDQIERGVLDLEDALEIYEVTIEQYMDFFAKEQNAQAQMRFGGKSPKFQIQSKIKYINKYFHVYTQPYESDLIVSIGDNMDKLEEEVAHGKIRVIGRINLPPSNA